MKSGKPDKNIPGLSHLENILEVCRLLNKESAQYLVAGGIAAQMHGLMRATKDIDLLIPKDVKNTECVLKALSHIGFGIAKEANAEEVTHKPFTIIGDIPRIDLLTVANKVKFSEAQPKALTVKIDGITIPYLDLKTLIKSKNTGRPQDEIDIKALKKFNK